MVEISYWALLGQCLVGFSLCFAIAATAAERDASIQLGRALYRGYLPWSKAEQATVNHLPTEFSACARCHGATGAGQTEGGVFAPALEMATLKRAINTMPSYQDDLAILQAIEQGKGRGGAKLNPVMPRFNLTAPEKQALLDYLHMIGTAADLPSGVTANKIRVGVLLPLEGQAASIGIAVLQGLRPPIDEINKRGGILGRQIELIVRNLSLDANTITIELKTLINEEHIYALVASFAGMAALPESENPITALLAKAHFSNIASLNMPLKSTGLEDQWSAPLLPSLTEQVELLEAHTRQACPISRHEWVLDNVGVMAAPAKQKTEEVTQQVFEAPSELVGDMHLLSSAATILPYRVLSFADAPVTAMLAAALSKLPLADHHKPTGCIGYLPFQAGGLPNWPAGWTEIMVSPFPEAMLLKARAEHTSLWQILGQLAGQTLIEALAQSGPRLHERSLLEALPNLNGMALQPGIHLAYRRDHLHGLEASVTIGETVPEHATHSSAVFAQPAKAKALFN